MSGAAVPSAIRNRLLRRLPAESLARLLPKLTPWELALRDILHEAGKPIETVYFPETGWISLLAYFEDGDSSEVGLAGNEGIVGIPIVLGGSSYDVEAMVQGPGTAWSMNAGALRTAMDEDRPLRDILLRHILLHHGQVVRTAACNARHHIDQRLARWLLMAHDRSEGDEFAMTHEFLSMMLGVRRAGVTTAANTLQRAGYIEYGRGRLRITDRPGLESASCECYGIVRRATDALLGADEAPVPATPLRA